MHQWHGDLSNYTSLMEDLWYKLTVTMPVSRVLYLELAVETIVIFSFAAILWLLALAEKDDNGDVGPEWSSQSGCCRTPFQIERTALAHLCLESSFQLCAMLCDFL